MTIKTKFNIGDRCYAVIDNEIKPIFIESIDIDVSKTGIQVKYRPTTGFFSIKEKNLYTKKEELINHITGGMFKYVLTDEFLN